MKIGLEVRESQEILRKQKSENPAILYWYQLVYISCAMVYLTPGITKRSLYDRKTTRIKSSPAGV